LALCAKRKILTQDEKIIALFKFDFFEFNSSLLLEYGQQIRCSLSEKNVKVTAAWFYDYLEF